MAVPIPKLTVDQYLVIEREAEYRSEYYQGEMFVMAGGTRRHSRLAVRFASMLQARLDGRGCEIYKCDIKVQIEPGGLNTYPDVSVACGEPQFTTEVGEVLVNPRVIVEVLSKSTEANDRGFKFQEYKKIRSLQEYILVSQTEPLIERFGRNSAGVWTEYSEARGLEAVIELKSLGIEIPLEELYRERSGVGATPHEVEA